MALGLADEANGGGVDEFGLVFREAEAEAASAAAAAASRGNFGGSV
jgi:hypothetical protein